MTKTSSTISSFCYCSISYLLHCFPIITKSEKLLYWGIELGSSYYPKFIYNYISSSSKDILLFLNYVSTHYSWFINCTGTCCSLWNIVDNISSYLFYYMNSIFTNSAGSEVPSTAYCLISASCFLSTFLDFCFDKTTG